MIGSLLSTLANAQKLSVEQLQKGIQDGTIDSYIAVPLIAQKTKQMKEATAILAGQKEQGQPPVGEQVMQAADQVTRPEIPLASTSPATDRQGPAPSQGIAGAPSNLPQSFAGGGIIAFSEGDLVDDSYDYDYGNPDSTEGRMVRQAAGLVPDGAEMYSARSLGTLYPLSEKSMGISNLVDKAKLNKTGPLAHILPGSRGRGAYEGEPIAATRGRGATYIPDAPLEFSKPQQLPNAELKYAEASPLPNAELDETPYEMADIRREAAKAIEAPKPTPKTEEIKTKDDGLKVERGVAAPATPQEAPTQTPASAPREGEFDQYMQKMQADRDELKQTILGQKASRAKDENDNLSNSLMKAGFGMMAARSPWAMTNIGEGATAGLDTYSKGIEQIKGNDDKVVQQLVSMGLKGQDLDNAAMKLGVDLRQQKMMEPYYASVAAENKAKMGLYPVQAKLYGAQAGLTGAQTEKQYADTNQTNVETALLPTKVANEGIRAAGAGAGRAGKTGVSDTYMKEAQKTRDAYLLDPSSSPHVSDDLKEALAKYKPGSPSYNDAVARARQQVKEQYYRDIGETGYYKGSGASSGSSEE